MPRRHLRSLFYDSARWDGFAFRDDDIVIATPAKCGTTWTQRIVSLLVFDSVELPQPLAHVSPWLDMLTRPLDDVLAELEAQQHRRFIKSHLPFDALPFDERVTYITVGRDPRDAAISRLNHWDNMDMDKVLEERATVVGPDEVPPDANAPRPDDWVEEWLNESLGTLVHTLASYWQERDRPNVVLLHYSDLQRDLVGQMASLAQRLGIAMPLERIAELAPAASFEAMKADARGVAPNADQTFWRSTDDFFRTGTSGQWRAVMSDAELARYDEKLRELVDDEEFADWLHNGTSG